MKKKLSIGATLVILLMLTVLLMENKTFLKEYYKGVYIPKLSYLYNETEGRAKFLSLKSSDSLTTAINKYIDTLRTCYDEGYFYDDEAKVTISEYTVNKGFVFNTIKIDYVDSNLCDNEYVLKENWQEEIINNAIVSEVIINKCVVNDTCYSKSITNSDLESIFDYLDLETTERVDVKNNFSFNVMVDYYYIEAYYKLDNNNFMLEIFEYNNNLAFKIIDNNDHQQNALYKVDNNVKDIFINLYN